MLLADEGADGRPAFLTMSIMLLFDLLFGRKFRSHVLPPLTTIVISLISMPKAVSFIVHSSFIVLEFNDSDHVYR